MRLLTAVPICDGHDSAINTVNLELVRHGFEVVYLGYHRAARDIVRAALQEDVGAVGLSSYNGGHVEFFSEVVRLLADAGSPARVFGGGGGTITPADAEQMRAAGVDRIFPAGTSLDETVAYARALGAGLHPDTAGAGGGKTAADALLGRALTALEAGRELAPPFQGQRKRARCIGVTGPGGAGKTTLIDELALRFLRTFGSEARLAILSHDPTLVGAGALLGDRATMIHAQHDRVFMRSLATRGQTGGVSAATQPMADYLASCGRFEAVILETVGVGQEALPFAAGGVDRQIVVLPPDYGSRLQLQKIAVLDVADGVVVNKADRPGAKTALAELEERLGERAGGGGATIFATVATRHRDPGVDQLFARLFDPLPLPPTEGPCP